jgi:hypothetical protein
MPRTVLTIAALGVASAIGTGFWLARDSEHERVPVAAAQAEQEADPADEREFPSPPVDHPLVDAFITTLQAEHARTITRAEANRTLRNAAMAAVMEKCSCGLFMTVDLDSHPKDCAWTKLYILDGLKRWIRKLEGRDMREEDFEIIDTPVGA